MIITAIFPDLPHHGGKRDVTPELSSLEEEDLSPGKNSSFSFNWQQMRLPSLMVFEVIQYLLIHLWIPSSSFCFSYFFRQRFKEIKVRKLPSHNSKWIRRNSEFVWDGREHRRLQWGEYGFRKLWRRRRKWFGSVVRWGVNLTSPHFGWLIKIHS